MSRSSLASVQRLTDDDADDLRVQVEAERARRSLAYFIRKAWHIVEPSRDLVWGWHLDAIIEHLEAVTRGELTKLVINVPPRCTKSLLVSVFWQAWWWTFAPEIRFLSASYVQTLATRDAVRTRRIIQSSWYARRWGDVFQLTTDQNVKTRYENDRTGHRISTSVSGAGTGEGGDVVVVDDPHNVKEAESELKREGTLVWWDEIMSTRLNDPAAGARVIIQQRVHERDLTGHVLATERGYEHLCLPMEFDPARKCSTSIGWEDPRERDGELLWPDRYTPEVLASLKIELGPYGVAGQLQQRPTPRSGGMFERRWYAIGDDVPASLWYVGYVDKAGSVGRGARTAMGLLGMNLESGATWIVDMICGRWEMADRERHIDDTAEHWGRLLGGRHKFKLFVEQEGGSGGKDSALLTVQRLTKRGFIAEVDPAVVNKFTRADHFAGASKARMVTLREGAWNEPLLRELESAGPGAAFLDQMDVCSGAYNKLIAVRDSMVDPGFDEVFDYDDDGGFRL